MTVINAIQKAVVTSSIRMSGKLLSTINYKGFWRTARLIGKLAPADMRHTIAIGKSGNFTFRLSDPYWARLVQPGFRYEQEIEAFLTNLGNRDISFLDCGANHGYWSIIAADSSIGLSSVVAIEASPLTYKMLSMNQRNNGESFKIMQRAIFSEDDQLVHIQIDDDNHAGAGLQKEGSGTEPVRSITIDTLARSVGMDKPILIKLDVEGAEIQALQGAADTIQSDSCFIYEDHGADQHCKITEWIMANTDYRIFYRDKGRYIELASTEALKAIKTDVRKGYNLFATRADSSFARYFV